ncbi:MAG: hypothetical protein RL367_2789 [Pseudomonadota bacterium]|jgi:hypothetical protein
MAEETSADLIEIATIFSRPEMICFTTALRVEGLIVDICGDHHINATLFLVPCGGYRVRVPGYQKDEAVALIEELRLQTEALTPPDDLRWGIRMLFGIKLVAMTVTMVSIAPGFGIALMSILLAAGSTMVPMTMPGDYLNRRGKLVQMR